MVCDAQLDTIKHEIFHTRLYDIIQDHGQLVQLPAAHAKTFNCLGQFNSSNHPVIFLLQLLLAVNHHLGEGTGLDHERLQAQS